MQWQPRDSAALRTFHEKTKGALRKKLAEMIPPLEGHTIEAVALEAKFRAGAEYLLQVYDELLELRSPGDEPENDKYQEM